MQHLFWALIAALLLRGAERGAAKAALIASAVSVLLSLPASGTRTPQT